MMKNKKHLHACIVTGGSGFIGTHLLTTLVNEGLFEQIHVLDLKPPKLNDPRIVFHPCDIKLPIPFTLDTPDATCYHLAALCKEPGYQWDEYFSVNHQGTAHICKFAKNSGVNNLIYTSTEMVYRASDKAMQENDITAPDTAYGMSKLLGELEIRCWKSENQERRIRIIRPGVVFGKGENGNFTRLFKALDKHLFFYIGRKTTIKSCIYVKDVAKILQMLIADNGGHCTYNLAYQPATSIQMICDAICNTLAITRSIPTIPYSLALAASYFFEALSSLGLLKTSIHHRRIQKLYYSTHMNCDALKDLGFIPSYSLAEALADWHSDFEYNLNP